MSPSYQPIESGGKNRNYLRKNKRATISEFKKLLNTIRRYILPIL
ncbi:MAG: SelB C-terminal domain-containing protein, partial [Fidelibacterota bacterium]